MKNIILLFFLLSNFIGLAQYTLIPDVNFEKALIGLGIDSGAIDGKVLTSNVRGLTSLGVSANSISNLTGIQDFVNLTDLECSRNTLTSLDVTKNTALKLLNCWGNNLTSLDLSKNTNLTYLSCFQNRLKSLDISKNSQMSQLFCSWNELTSLNLKNGNNKDLFALNAFNNPNLSCIQIDNITASNSWDPNKKDATASYSENCSFVVSQGDIDPPPAGSTIQPPVITATGNQIYCPGSSQKIVVTISITPDPAELSTDAIYIQISSGYDLGQDELKLSNPTAHPLIITSWDPAAGKLKLSSPTGNKILYTDFEAAIRDIVYSNSSPNPSGTRSFSITIGQANFLPSTGHYYQYIPNLGISWTAAKTAAEGLNYYGLKGYLATVLSSDEAQITGEQASGAGWIGGSDQEIEGTWKWVTGPEGLSNGGTGLVFWNGLANGSTPNYAKWNRNEPNQNFGRDEDYAHITAPGIGIAGSWNDISLTGEPIGDYQPKGFIVEYGGMPGETALQISASTSLYFGVIDTVSTVAPNCGSGISTFTATANGATINWYDSLTAGSLVFTGESFITPNLTVQKSYFADAGCSTVPRTEFIGVVKTIPTIIPTNILFSRCGPGDVSLKANSDVGTINWYSTATSTIVLGIGKDFLAPNLTSDSIFYVEAENKGCTNGIRVPVNVTIYKLPLVDDDEVTKCKLQSIELDAEITGMFYAWSTGEKTQKISVASAGVYTVDVTSPAPEGCTSIKTITVTENEIPEITAVVVTDNTVEIMVKKEELYFEYSIDGFSYQDSNVFTKVPNGLQNAYVRDTNRCDRDFEPFVVLTVPKFFTPNGDGKNDSWEIEELQYYPQSSITVFDRFGKLITVLNKINYRWDGTFNGKNLPADDYWYIFKIDSEKPEKKGHFSLKR